MIPVFPDQTPDEGHVAGLNRIPITVSVLMLMDNEQCRTVKTRDISDDGVFLIMEEPRPALGERLRAQVVGLGDGDAPVVELEVTEVTAEGVDCSYI